MTRIPSAHASGFPAEGTTVGDRRYSNAYARTQRPKAAPRACHTQSLGIMPRFASPAAAGSRKPAIQAGSQHSAHDGRRPPLQQRIRPHAAAEGRAAWMPYAKPRHHASLCFAGRRRLAKARHPGGQSTLGARRSETAATARAVKRYARTQRPKAAPRGCPAPARRGSTPRRAAAPPQPRCGHGRPEGGRSAGWSHLGCDHAGPSLPGPWMARQA
jgi:hypothetical protein